MKHDEFIGKVQHAARLASREDAERATRVVLETLRQRLGGGLPGNVASQLPPEIGRHLDGPGDGERFDSDEFFRRVSVAEEADLPDAVHHVRSVLEVLGEAVSRPELERIHAQLPDDYARMFAGSEGRMPA